VADVEAVLAEWIERAGKLLQSCLQLWDHGSCNLPSLQGLAANLWNTPALLGRFCGRLRGWLFRVVHSANESQCPPPHRELRVSPPYLSHNGQSY
jgi:hypothetical protein